MADNWTINYRERTVGPDAATHGVIEVHDPSGKPFKSYEGLATRPDGTTASIGSELNGDSLKGYYYTGSSNNAESPPQEVFSGSEDEVKARMGAMQEATDQINSQNVPYQLPGLGSALSALTFGKGDNTNSNSYMNTMFKVLGQDVPSSSYSTLLGQEGGDASLLTDQQIQGITGKYGPNFDTLPPGAADPASKNVLPNSFAIPPANTNTGTSLDPSDDNAYDYSPTASPPPANSNTGASLDPSDDTAYDYSPTAATNDNQPPTALAQNQTANLDQPVAPLSDQQSLTQFTTDVAAGDSAPTLAVPIALATDTPPAPTLLTSDAFDAA